MTPGAAGCPILFVPAPLVFFALPLMQTRSAAELLLSARACHFPAAPRFQWLTLVLAEVVLLGRDRDRWRVSPAFLVLPFPLTILPCFGNTKIGEPMGAGTSHRP
jgi:hypothetical protein